MNLIRNIKYIVLHEFYSTYRSVGVAIIIIIISQLLTTVTIAQNPAMIAEINKRAQEYYDKKELSKAIIEWLKILEIDPNNEEVQRKIELVYEEKHKKDISLQRAKLHYRLSRKMLPDNVKNAQDNSKIAIENFIIAYRMDPNDPELQVLREDT